MSSKKKTSSSRSGSGTKIKPEPGGEGVQSALEWAKESRKNVGHSVADFNFNKKRLRVLTSAQEVPVKAKAILYWMMREARVDDNWGLLYAQRLALKLRIPLHVCFCLVPKFLGATIRQYSFLVKGLQEVETQLKTLSIPFHLILGEAPQRLPQFIGDNEIGAVVTDFFPLRLPASWVDSLIERLPKEVPLCQVDGHNIVPCWVASDKQEYAARTIRPKITNKLPEFLTHFPPVIAHPYQPNTKFESNDWDAAIDSLQVDRTGAEVNWAQPGSKAGFEMLDDFCRNRLKRFASSRNDPTTDSTSNLSPWLHFGHISAQRIVLFVKQYKLKYKESVEAFVEETVIRRELSDNFCFYNEKYDQMEGASSWAQKTLKEHAKDKRTYLYTREELALSTTHDRLWNAAQTQMVREGKMHGFLRMYWAKKILEWTQSPEEALEFAIYLNDKYSLDGRDPNGYVGCMWSICGIHDMGWKERPIFGKIRFMNFEGCKRKFDVNAFIASYH